MKNRFFNIINIIFFTTTPILAASESESDIQSSSSIAEILMLFLTIIVIGGVIYSLYISMTGIGGLVGQGLKLVGIGVILLSINIIDEIFGYLTGYGLVNLVGTGEANFILHHALTQLGFVFIAWGLIKLAKMVKSLQKNK